jgi:hypothetical protein
MGTKRKSKGASPNATRGIYSGCIHRRKNVPSGRIRRKAPSPTAIKLQERARRQILNLAHKTSIAECTWSTSSYGGVRQKNLAVACCSNRFAMCNGLNTWLGQAHGEEDDVNQADVATVVARMRRYIASLDKVRRRDFIAQYSYYTGYDLDNVRGIRKGAQLYTFFLPSLQDMKRALDDADVRETLLPPVQGDLNPVCNKWFFFVTGLSMDAVYNQALRNEIYSKGPIAVATDLDVGIPVQRNLAYLVNRARPQSNSCVQFLLELAEISEFMPHQAKGKRPTCVIPCRTFLAAHRLYVGSMERSLGVEWAREQDIELHMHDPEPAETVAARQKRAEISGGDAEEKRVAPDRRVEEEENNLLQFKRAMKKKKKKKQNIARQLAHSVSAVRRVPPRGGQENVEDVSASEEQLSPVKKKRRLIKGPGVKRSVERGEKRYRYGNKLCGLKRADRPESPDVAKYTWFCKVWCNEPDLAHIIIRAHLPFAKCTICVRQRAYFSMKRTQAERDADTLVTLDHLDAVAKEKRCYYSHRSKARKYDKRFLSMIIDGADQSKYDLPYWCEKNHASDEVRRLKMHLYGVLCHGRKAYCFAMPDHEAHGHNTTIKCIWKVIVDQYIEGGNKLPPVLFLQLDNTTRQNKGQFLIGFLKLLVQHGIFERIYVCFLPVGHTHEDIDQMFSRLAIALRGRNMLSRDQMTQVIENAYLFEGAPPKVEHWDRLDNIRDWIDQYIKAPAGIMKYRHFRISKADSGASAGGVMVQVRDKMTLDMEENWKGMEENTNRTFLFTTPFGVPNLWKFVKNDEMPCSIKRDTTDEEILKMRQGLAKLAGVFPNFTLAAQLDCEEIVRLFEKPALKFNWKKEHVKMLFAGEGNGAARKGGNSVSIGAQNNNIFGNLGQEGIEEGQIYLLRPLTHWKGGPYNVYDFVYMLILCTNSLCLLLLSDATPPIWLGRAMIREDKIEGASTTIGYTSTTCLCY